MPTVGIVRDLLFASIGKSFSEAEFDDLCFQFGIELDDVVEASEEHNGQTVYKLDVPANRVDLLCFEGLARALKVFVGNGEAPKYKFLMPEPRVQMEVKKECCDIRPFGFAAILRNITFTEASYKSLIDLQEKLHENIGRKRTLVAIGTHDLDTVEPPFSFEALPPHLIRFAPLNTSVVSSATEIMATCEKSPQLRRYVHLIQDSPVYPVIYDKNQVVLSMPPIINGEHTRITLNTKNVFIDVTATDFTKGQVVLNTIVAMFSEHCSPSFHIEPVKVVYETGHRKLGGNEFIFPNLASRHTTCRVPYVRQIVGDPELSGEHACSLLEQMMLRTSQRTNDDLLDVEVPITRTDVLHECDIAEDVAIAYGFNNIRITDFPFFCDDPLSSLTNQIRRVLSTACYHEALNWGLCSRKEAFDFLYRTRSVDAAVPVIGQYRWDQPPVSLSNPKTKEFEIVRTSLIPGLLKTLAANKGKELPIKLFELGDVVVLDKREDTGCHNVRYCCVLFANSEGAGLEELHGALDLLLNRFGIESGYSLAEGREDGNTEVSGDASSQETASGEMAAQRNFTLTSMSEATFLKGRQVRITVLPENLDIGVMGTLHPNVLKEYGLQLPASVIELNVEAILQWLPLEDLFDD